MSAQRPMVTPTTARSGGDHRDNWIQTASGRQFFPFRPEDSEVAIEDIAHALSHVCRFTGHVQEFYSVAQHSVFVSQLVPPQFARHGLLHDAAEAYVADISSPVKAGIPEYREIEDRVMARIGQEFGLSAEEPPEVKRADLIAVATEARDLMANPPTVWNLPEQPIAGIRVVPLGPRDARELFLARFRELWS